MENELAAGREDREKKGRHDSKGEEAGEWVMGRDNFTIHVAVLIIL